MAVDNAGSVYFVDASQAESRVRKVAGGIITTVVGAGPIGYSGDGGPATSAQLKWPWGLVLDSSRNLYIADTWNQVVRKVSGGIITTVAGTGVAGYAGDGGPAGSAQLRYPSYLAFDLTGNLYIVDEVNYCIRMISQNTIYTVAGNGTVGYSGDGGIPTNARMRPASMAFDAAGNWYISDAYNYRIRRVFPAIL